MEEIDEEDHADQRKPQTEHAAGAGDVIGLPEEVKIDQGILCAKLPDGEGDGGDGGNTEQHEGPQRRPAGELTASEPIKKCPEPGGQERDARIVDACPGFQRLGDELPARGREADERGDNHIGDVEREDAAPAHHVGQEAADQRSQGKADGHRRCEHA